METSFCHGRDQILWRPGVSSEGMRSGSLRRGLERVRGGRGRRSVQKVAVSCNLERPVAAAESQQRTPTPQSLAWTPSRAMMSQLVLSMTLVLETSRPSPSKVGEKENLLSANNSLFFSPPQGGHQRRKRMIVSQWVLWWECLWQ